MFQMFQASLWGIIFEDMGFIILEVIKTDEVLDVIYLTD